MRKKNDVIAASSGVTQHGCHMMFCLRVRHAAGFFSIAGEWQSFRFAPGGSAVFVSVRVREPRSLRYRGPDLEVVSLQSLSLCRFSSPDTWEKCLP